MLIKWTLQNSYEFQRREPWRPIGQWRTTKKPREESLDKNPEVDSVFSTSMDSPECLQILFSSLLNVEKSVKKIREMQDKTRSSQIKGELQLKDLSEAV